MRSEVGAAGGGGGIHRGVLATLVAIHAERTISSVIHGSSVGKFHRGEGTQLVRGSRRSGLAVGLVAGGAVDRRISGGKSGSASDSPDEAGSGVASHAGGITRRIARGHGVNGVAPFGRLDVMRRRIVALAASAGVAGQRNG